MSDRLDYIRQVNALLLQRTGYGLDDFDSGYLRAQRCERCGYGEEQAARYVLANDVELGESLLESGAFEPELDELEGDAA